MACNNKYQVSCNCNNAIAGERSLACKLGYNLYSVTINVNVILITMRLAPSKLKLCSVLYFNIIELYSDNYEVINL